MAKQRIALTAVVLACLALVVSSASASSSSSLRQGSYCPPAVQAVKKSQVVLYVYMEVRKNKSPVRDISFSLRDYHGAHYRVPGWAYSGCWSTLVFSRNSPPRKLCLSVKSPFAVVGEECKKVLVDELGRRRLVFFVNFT